MTLWKIFLYFKFRKGHGQVSLACRNWEGLVYSVSWSHSILWIAFCSQNTLPSRQFPFVLECERTEGCDAECLSWRINFCISAGLLFLVLIHFSNCEERKAKIGTPVVLNICRRMTRECMFRYRMFQSGVLLHFHVYLRSVVLDVLDVSVFKYSTCLSAVTMVSSTCAGSPSGPLLHLSWNNSNSSWIFFISEFASLTCVCIFSLTLCALTFTCYCLMLYLVVVPVVPVWQSINLIQTSNVKSCTLIFVVVVVVETLNWGAVLIGLFK